MWRITCGECGKTSIADQWLETVMGPLPAGHLQCPECKVRIKKKSELPTVVVAENGRRMVIPGKVTLERVPSCL